MTREFVLQVIAIFLGGGTVQAIIALLKRRAEIRGLDASAGAVSLEASNNLITRLQLDGQQLREQQSSQHGEHLREVEELTRRLTSCAETVTRQQREVALLRTDIGIAQQQIQQLTGQDPYRGAPPPRHEDREPPYRR